jgi:uncharacterized protein (TIGR02246 family)
MCNFISRSFRALIVAFVIGVAAPSPTSAKVNGAAAAIATRLTDWVDAFNAREVSRTCDLFSADLISTMRGRPDEGREAVCDRIAKALASRRSRIHYTLHIKEIIVSGDIAIARLEWRVKTRTGPVNRLSYEPGIDIFRKEADGEWRIIRFIAFSVTSRR